uniref:Ribonuclease III n=1 Tax=Solanum tuberosum TaxID=4113 RepID=M1AL99_SOLTU
MKFLCGIVIEETLNLTQVKEFVKTVQQEEEIEFYGGTIKELEVLADIVESIMGAVYLDCGFDVNDVWVSTNVSINYASIPIS